MPNMTDLMPIVHEASAWWRGIFVFDLGRYLIAAGAMATLLSLGLRWIDRRKIQVRRATFADRRREFFYSVATVAVFALVGVSIQFGGEAGVIKIVRAPLPNLWVGIAEFVAATLFHDAYFYWAHRAMHHPRLYRTFHLVHHKSRTPTPWAAYAFALPEALVEAAVLPIYMLVLPLHQTVVLLFMTHMIVRNVVGHSGHEVFPRGWLDWPWVAWFNTNTHHDLHHSTFNYNYGLYFRWWDRMMGTEHPQYKARFDDVTSRAGREDTAVPAE